MKNNHILKMCIVFFVTFITVLSFSGNVEAKLSREEILNNKEKYQTKNYLEMTVSELALGLGDFVMEYIVFIVKEEVTIQKIIYNKIDSLNANFFINGLNPSSTVESSIIRNAIIKWYNLLNTVVLMIYMMALVVVGIMTLLRRSWRESQSARTIRKMDTRNCNPFPFPICNEICF